MTDDELKELVASLAVTVRETNASIRETDVRLSADIRENNTRLTASIQENNAHLTTSMRENDARLTASMRENDARLTAGMRETDERLREMTARMAAEHQKTEESFQRLHLELADFKTQIAEFKKSMGEMGNIQGDVAEDLFRRNVAALLRARGITVDTVETNLKAPGLAEYDIVALNGNEAVVVEVKNKLKQEHLKKLIERRLPQFKEGFPKFASFRLYGGVGALVVSEAVEKQAQRMGLFVFTQTADGGAAIVNPPAFEPKIF